MPKMLTQAVMNSVYIVQCHYAPEIPIEPTALADLNVRCSTVWQKNKCCYNYCSTSIRTKSLATFILGLVFELKFLKVLV